MGSWDTLEDSEGELTEEAEELQEEDREDEPEVTLAGQGVIGMLTAMNGVAGAVAKAGVEGPGAGHLSSPALRRTKTTHQSLSLSAP